jgi:ABC-2 type transport system ATP-binding protein
LENVLTVKHVSKRFGKHTVLNDISFQVPKGSIVGLIGPNGVGKSTVMKIILGIYASDSGEVRFNDAHSAKGAKRVGALIESPAIYPFLTGREQLMLYSHKDSNDVRKIVEVMGMTDYVDKPVAHYSLGMKQKTGIAIALLQHPELVILDEPMNGLDPMSNRDLRNLILKLAKNGTTFLVSSHILSELEKMIDQVVLLDHGNVVLADSMIHLHELGANYLSLMTSSNDQCAKLLAANRFRVAETSMSVRVSLTESPSLNDLFNILLTHHIQINDVQHLQTDLEESVLTLLEHQGGNK